MVLQGGGTLFQTGTHVRKRNKTHFELLQEIQIVQFSSPDSSKCTPFYVTCFQKFQNSTLFKTTF
jgi:hypothetical protein